MKKVFNIITKIIFYIIIVILGIYIGFSLTAQKHIIETFGVKPFVVKSNSMKPMFQRGDIIIVNKVNSNAVKKGDIIAVRKKNNMLIAHMVADEIIDENHKLVFKTRPINNVEKANWDIEGVYRYQVVGKVNKVIPKLGFLVLCLQNPYIYVPLIVLVLIVILLKNYGKDNLVIKLNKNDVEDVLDFKKENKEK